MSVFDEKWLAHFGEVRLEIGDGLFVPHPMRDDRSHDDVRAKLAAAAPEMYRALRALGRLDRAEGCADCGAVREHAEYCALAAALAKAEGR